MVAAEQRHVALAEPRDHGRVETCGPPALGAAPQPWPLSLAARPHAGTDEQRVTRSDLHAGALFPGLQVLDVDRRARLEERHALQPRDVDQHAAREDAVLEVVDRV